MEYLQYRTRNGASPQGKPRVYFTCHPEDFARTFDRICEDIFKTHDCVICYTGDMRAKIPEKMRAVDLERMNLFVIPVTFRLLTTPNRAMDEDFAFARERGIPVLPVMLEPGLDALYSAPDKFGELQYLNLYQRDMTAIPYEEKLKRYLQSVLVSDETAERIRAAFDAYIFLSYRKKDRQYANELMRLIHSNPVCRDIAIWYDEFLVPGESFRETIQDALRRSDLFALLVTPNLVNEPNYVQSTEYPAARSSGKVILPAEMVPTDPEALKRQYADIPACVNAHEDEAFRRRLVEAVSRLALRENDGDPVHNFLIGLAYLEGIDVEVDRERGLALITGAAEAGLPEAMEKLAHMYRNGAGVRLDYRKAAEWSERLVRALVRRDGEEHPDTLTAMHNLASDYSSAGGHQRARELYEKVYRLRRRTLGEDHPQTLTTRSNLADTYVRLGENQKALELAKKAYELFRRTLGGEHPLTLAALNNLAVVYGELGDYRRALELSERAYELRRKTLGEDHGDTLLSLNNLAYAHGCLGDYKKAMELDERAYRLSCRVLGEDHPQTLNTLGNLACDCGNSGDRRRALELHEKAYGLSCKVLGEDHPQTLNTLGNLAYDYAGAGDRRKARELLEKTYELYRKTLGEENPRTLNALSNLAWAYSELDDYQKQLELNQKAYTLRQKVLGGEHPDTLISLNNLANAYGNLGEYRQAVALGEKAYTLCRRSLGENHPYTQAAKRNLEDCRRLLGQQTPPPAERKNPLPFFRRKK